MVYKCLKLFWTPKPQNPKTPWVIDFKKKLTENFYKLIALEEK